MSQVAPEFRIVPLSKSFHRERFRCGDEALERWFATQAGQSQRRDKSRTFVAVSEGDSVLGFYALGLFEESAQPEPQQSKTQRISGYKILRLAVASDYQGKGLGRLLLIDALRRCLVASEVAGGAGVFVDAKPGKDGFYRKFGSLPLSNSAVKLFISMSQLRESGILVRTTYTQERDA